MDLQDRDESKRRRREEMLARRLGEALDQMDARNAGHCPDGEILAAYAERALSVSETEKWESHFSTCARCRKILMVLAASADAPLAEKEVAHLGERVAATRGPLEVMGKSAGRSRPWFADWRMRWLVPALSAAAVLAVWFTMWPPWRAPARSASETLVAQAPKEEMQPSQAPQQAVRPSRGALSLGRKSEPAPQAKKENGPSPQEQKSVSEAPPENAPAGPSAGILDKSNENQISAQAQAKAQALAPLPAHPPAGALGPSTAADTMAPSAPAASPAIPPSTSQTVTVTEAAPVVDSTNGTLSKSLEPETRANLPINGRDFESLARLKAAPGSPIVLSAPGNSVLWRVGMGGSIERSMDGGKNWVAQTSPSRQDWLAGAVISDKVCWLVGRKGAIARTLDGEHWDLIPSPSVAAGANTAPPDWVGITSFDTLSAAVTAADGRKFVTSDGGVTWQRQ